MNLAKKPPAINSVPNKLLYLPGVNGMLPNKSILKQYWIIILTAKKTSVIVEIIVVKFLYLFLKLEKMLMQK